MKYNGKEGSTDAMKMTDGKAKSGASSNSMGMKDVKMPFGGNVSYTPGDKLPKSEKGIC